MVTHLNSQKIVNFFFANYKSSVVKNVRSFRVPISSQLILLVKTFYKANLIYSYTLDRFSNSIIVYPRFSFRNKNFQIFFHAHKSFHTVTQLSKYLKAGYHFIVFSPFSRKKFFTSTEFSGIKHPGYLLFLW